MAIDRLYGVDMTKVMYGQYALHIPAWMVVQNQGPAGVILAGASRSLAPLYGSTKAHVMVVGELIIRPHLVIASNAFIGRGAGGFWTDPPTADEWLEQGDILLHQDYP